MLPPTFVFHLPDPSNDKMLHTRKPPSASHIGKINYQKTEKGSKKNLFSQRCAAFSFLVGENQGRIQTLDRPVQSKQRLAYEAYK